jgi:hypothetical protein
MCNTCCVFDWLSPSLNNLNTRGMSQFKRKVTVFNIRGLAKTKRDNGLTNRDANSHFKIYLLTAINMMFMDEEQRWVVKNSVQNEQPVLTKYLQDSESQLLSHSTVFPTVTLQRTASLRHHQIILPLHHNPLLLYVTRRCNTWYQTRDYNFTASRRNALWLLNSRHAC